MTVRLPLTNPKVRTALKNLSVKDFKDFGMQQIAYIRAVNNNNDNSTLYSIHSADGEEISVMDTLDQAIIATRKNDLEPVTLH
ncbi:MAG: hypothetical protein COB14_00280 [Alphaproteobacteria bacterium]|nr:MAG: hypothetical protein COB14_00280 [Alphaproteobacteria bacterium]